MFYRKSTSRSQTTKQNQASQSSSQTRNFD